MSQGVVLLFEQLGIAALLVGGVEIAFRRGRRRAASEPGGVRRQITTMQAAALGLLGLLLGFSLSMAEARFAQRRQIIVQEANAIGSAYMLTALLPEPDRAPSRALLKRYAGERLAYLRIGGDEDQRVRSADTSTAILTDLWGRAAPIARAAPTSQGVALYAAALLKMADLENERFVAVFATVPGPVVLLVVLVAFVATGSTGFSCGLTRKREVVSMVVVPILIAFACAVVLELDRPRTGLILVGDAALERVERAMQP